MIYRTAGIAILILCLLAQAATAQSYVFHELYSFERNHASNLAYGIGPGGEVVGASELTLGFQAVVWNQATPSGTFLPNGFTAYGTDGESQVGYTTNISTAALWNGTAGSYVNLTPVTLVNNVPVSTWPNSYATAVSGKRTSWLGLSKWLCRHTR